ncbi:hypothetical protein N234_31855 [Ralstonia pickettii DTP0602]|nr:hypothetical protein N234_31855 [Ralstonia pickettii DTP0602]
MQQSVKTNDRAGILPTPRHRFATPPSKPTRPAIRLAGRPPRRIAQETAMQHLQHASAHPRRDSHGALPATVPRPRSGTRAPAPPPA